MSAAVAQSNLFDFFNDQVGDALKITGAHLSGDTKLYLTHLLAERARAETRDADINTLAELHARAAFAAPGASARTYRELGDRALYQVGFFEESIARKTVSPQYYVDMGAAAYLRVDELFKRWFSDAFGPVFRELGSRFPECIAVFQIIKDRNGSSKDLLRLYEDWSRTGSPATAQRLRAKGLLLSPSSSEES